MDRVTGRFKVVEYYATRGGARIVLEDQDGKRYSMFASEFLKIIHGMDLGELTLEKTRKGIATGWRKAKEAE